MENEIKAMSIIYKITNNENGKIYIGKTKTHYGNKPNGIKGRMRDHIKKALRGDTDGCPALYNAICKYGKEKFTIEEILQCEMEDVDTNEIEQIEIHNSTDKNIGYNIALGGGGRSVAIVTEETRKKISKDVENMNLKKVFRKGVLVGYRARRRNNGGQYEKCFSSTENTVEENKKLAQEWINNFRENDVIGEANYNKESKLPKNIYKVNEKGNHVGYIVNITRNGKTTVKNFQSNDTSLDELLKKAVAFRDEFLKKVKIDE